MSIDKDSVCSVSAPDVCNLNDLDPAVAASGLNKWTAALAAATNDQERATSQIGIDFHKTLIWCLDHYKATVTTH